MVTWLPVPWLKFLTYGSLNPCASTLKSHAHSQPICAQSVHMYVLSVHVHLLSVHVHLLSVHLCPLSVHMRPLYLLCPLNAHVFPCLQMFFPFPTDSDVRLDPFTSLNTVCVQHIMVKMCGRESFALTHASWGFGDGDPSLLLIAFCLPLIAWLLLPSSLSPTNVHSFLMGSGFSLLCYFYPSVHHVYLIFCYQITNRWEVFAQKELSCPGSALPSRVTSSPCWLVDCPS